LISYVDIICILPIRKKKANGSVRGNIEALDLSHYSYSDIGHVKSFKNFRGI